AGIAIPEIFQKAWQSDFSLVQHQMVYIRERLIFGREERTSGYNPDTDCPASRDHSFHRFFLDRHSAHKDEIGPLQVIVIQSLHVHVDQSFLPLFRKHRCYSQQSEGWTARLFVNELQGIPETPEGIREFRIN